MVVTTAQQRSIGQASPRTVRIATRGELGQYFYLFMSLLIVAVIVYGFSFTLGKNLLHPAIPRP